jgi:hypothetical protein
MRKNKVMRGYIMVIFLDHITSVRDTGADSRSALRCHCEEYSNA